MKRRFDPELEWELLREKILGLGDQSIHKSHYPELQRKVGELAASEDRYRTLVNTVNVGIARATVDDPGRFLEANPAAVAIFGYPTLEALLKAPVADLYVNAGDREDLLEELARSGSIRRREVRMRHRAGGTIWIAWSGVRHLDAQGQATVHAVFEDITSRRKLESDLLHAQKMEAMGRLAGGVAHDFNNLLSVIIANSDLLLQGLAKGEAEHEYAEEVNRAAGRAAEVVRQLLAFSRKQDLAPRVLDVNQLVANTLKMVRRLVGENIRVETQLSPTVGRVRADPGQLEQALVNLVVNARDAMPAGGTLVLSTRSVEKSGACQIDGDRMVLLTVKDSGHGMDEATRARIFEPFFTTKPEGRGTGLGLSSVYGIVRQSGGCICVDSEEGAGSAFTVCFPELPQDTASEATCGTAAAERASGEVVLVVEDEAPVRRIIGRVLSDAGYEVIEAEDATAAQRAFELCGARLDLLLCDVVLPGQGGPELSAALCTQRPELRVLYVTGYTDRPAALGSWPVVRKPFNVMELLVAVRAALK